MPATASAEHDLAAYLVDNGFQLLQSASVRLDDDLSEVCYVFICVTYTNVSL